jgi:non-specific serine/threonine protein kinase
LGRDLKALQRFQREARAASALNHPNICTVYAIEQHDGSCSPPDCPSEHFIVMELLEGQTLAQMIDRRHRFDLTHLLDIAMQIADALESAHAKGIVHRDIKPAHIFLCPRGQVKILDFGIAQIEGGRALADSWGSEAETTEGQHLTVPGTAIGTVAYMSPEQARGWLTDARTDLLSLGTVLYQTATGGLPFKGETSATVFDALFNRDPVPVTQANAELPAEFGRILNKALEKDRNLRYQTATDLKTDLIRLRRDTDPAGRRPPKPLAPIRRLSDRSPCCSSRTSAA